MLKIQEVTTEEALAGVRALTLAFLDWLRLVYPEARAAFDQDADELGAELMSLSSLRRRPGDNVLAAYWEAELVGTVTLRDRGHRLCEMQRMFVAPSFRGKGVGRALATTLLAAAQAEGYAQMRLSTGARQVAALGLYRSLGFREIPAFHPVPPGLQPLIVFMERHLSDTHPAST